jgi:hypothetical protein
LEKNTREQKTKTRINRSSGGKRRARKNNMGKRTKEWRPGIFRKSNLNTFSNISILIIAHKDARSQQGGWHGMGFKILKDRFISSIIFAERGFHAGQPDPPIPGS